MFICAGVVHPKAIEYLKGRNRKYLIIPRYLYFPIYIKLKYFDFLYNTPSVAHMSYFLSVLLNHKNIIFIGQDLAYAENGNSHPDDYQNSANYESQMYEHILTEAYGGKKEIKTHEFWIFFKQILEAMIIKYHSKRKGISDTAIQLPLLKKYASKATIFCADSSYPILAKHGIKPDYVLSLERIPLTSEFFNNDFGEFDKDIMFIVKSVTHPHTIKYLQKNNRAFILVSTYASFIQYLKLDYFGYFNMGKSVANMSYLLTEYLNYKNIILIGQDLAYAKDGFSHTKDYKNLDKHEGHFQRDKGKFQCLAYGGNGKVESSRIWTMFRLIFENDINYFQKLFNITTYNCTEGGARIEGTIEKPFLWACENLLDKDLNKPFEKLEPLSLNKQNEFLLKAYYKVYQSIKHCRDFSKILSNDFEKIQSIYLSLNEKEEDINLAIEKIDEFKNKLEDIKQMQDLYEILGPLLTQFELNLARIYVKHSLDKRTFRIYGISLWTY